VGQVSVVTGGAGGMGIAAAAKIIGRDRTVVIADVWAVSLRDKLAMARET
jgi:NAD(P)-dependent dehydrogenase (short-subunit alcohol dehydrogenase family)